MAHHVYRTQAMGQRVLISENPYNSRLPRFYEVSGNTAYSGILQAKERILSFMKLGLEVANEFGISIVTYSEESALREVGISFDSKLLS
jgi:hypothetical protein